MLHRLLAVTGGGSGFTVALMANVIQPVYNVKLDFGAAGDDTADDLAKIQAAMDAAHADGGGIVYFPAGTYKLSGTLELAYPVTMIGAAPNTTRLKAYGSGTAIRFKNYSTAAARFDCHFARWTLTNAGSSTLGFDAKGLERSQLEQVRINGFSASGGVGLKVDGSYGSSIGAWWNTLLTCDISDNETNVLLTGSVGAGQANGNRIIGGRYQEFTLYGINVNVGNGCTIDGPDVSSTLSHTAAIRLNDHGCHVVNCLFDTATIGVKIDGGNKQYVVGNTGFGVGTFVQVNAGTGHTTTPNADLP